MKYLDNINNFRQRLANKKSAIKSHQKMMPKRNGKSFRPVKAPSSARNSAVMLLINKSIIDNSYSILLTLRSAKLNSHSGQISFPGGRMDAGETPIQTAIRETSEEVGIKVQDNQIIGSLTEIFVPNSNSTIFPIIAYSESEYNSEYKFNINPDEVAEVWLEPIDNLISSINIKEEIWNLSNYPTTVPFWDIHHSTPLWGASAIILSELIDILNDDY